VMSLPFGEGFRGRLFPGGQPVRSYNLA
jgi:hypothetical protein